MKANLLHALLTICLMLAGYHAAYALDTTEYPSQLFIIGEFNNWQTPSAEETNGAIAIDCTSQEYGAYNIETFFPEGEAIFLFYYNHDGEELYISGGNRYPELNLRVWPPTGEWFGVSDFLVEHTQRSEATPYHIKDWQGGNIEIQMTLYNSYVYISSNDAPAYTPPAQNGEIYMVYTIDGEKPQIETFPFAIENNFVTEHSLSGKHISFFFTTEYSTTPEESNIFGNTTGTTTATGNDYSASLPLIENGKPYSFEFTDYGKITFYAAWPNGFISVAGHTEDNPESSLTETAAEDAATEYFNLHGMKTDRPHNGIYIKRESGKTSKTVMP